MVYGSLRSRDIRWYPQAIVCQLLIWMVEKDCFIIYATDGGVEISQSTVPKF